MVQDADVQSLLNNGTWTTQRAKNPSVSTSNRANQSSRLERLEPHAPKAPGSLAGHLARGRAAPRPIVEDEAASVARELGGSVVSPGDEEPKCRGTVEQLPVLIPVPEHNPERRFVLVAPPGADDEPLPDDAEARGARPAARTKTRYEANTKIQLAPKVAEHGALPELQRRKSRPDLPRIETDFQPSAPPRSTAQFHRSRSATCVDQIHRQEAASRDYFGPHPESAQPAGSSFLSPNVIKHATKGRDRAYWDLNPAPKATDSRDPSPYRKPASADRRGFEVHAGPSHATGGATAQRRLHPDMDVHHARRTVERHSSYREEAHGSGRSRNGPPSPSSDRRHSPPRLSRRESSPARRGHAEPQRHGRDRPPRHHSRPPPPRDADLEDSSDEHREHRSRHPHRHRRKSMVIQEDHPALLSPLGPRPPPSSRSKSRPPSPLPSPRASQARLPDHGRPQPYDPRAPATFSVARDRRLGEIERPASPTSPGGAPPRSRSRLRVDDRDRASDAGRPRAPSRTPSIRSNASSSRLGSGALAPLLSTAPAPSAVAMPPTPTWSRQGSSETNPYLPSHWQPEPFPPPPQQSFPLTPRQSGSSLEEQPGAPVTSYRRYAEDVGAGVLPGLPDCPRQRPRAGHADWLTLPGCDGLHVCPSCYEQVFRPTEFRDLLVPAPARARDEEVACDLGSSPWYRIAWLLTRKHRRADLRLLRAVAGAQARHRRAPCRGAARVARTWHTVLDPQTRRAAVPDFTACAPCADAVQALFPSLAGVLGPSPAAGAGAGAGRCSLRFAPGRARFAAYFDAFEAAHDRAVADRAPPSVRRLADRIGFYSGIEECPRGEAGRRRQWYVMARVPELTVCQECFLDVVCPELVADADAAAAAAAAAASASAGDGGDDGDVVVSPVARNFYQEPQLIRSATVCQMASPWMRDLFRRACRREDGIEYLDARVREKLGFS